MTTVLTADETRLIREFRNEQQRKWWANQSEAERRARRDRYALNALRKRQQQERAEDSANDA